MKIVMVHNTYQQPGGEDIVFRNECELLKSSGHELVVYQRSNHDASQYVSVRQLALAKRTIWASDTRREFRELLLRERPDMVHIHNTFVMISPSIYWACRDARVPVVQTLHNYRLFCATGDFFRDGKVCEECSDRGLWRGVSHGCYHGSRTATATVALMLSFNRWRSTWIDGVDHFITLSAFSRQKFLKMGIPGSRLTVKPNFIFPDPGERGGKGEYALFIGRLSKEKGVATLLDAWASARLPIPLRIIGDGPLRTELEAQAATQELTNVTFLGRMTHEETMAAIKRASVLVHPSQCYEQCPTAILEAYACSVPVIAPALGAMQEMVIDQRTGLLYRPGDAQDLASKIAHAWTHPAEMEVMSKQARQEFEAKYSVTRNYEMLMATYQLAIQNHRARSVSPTQDLMSPVWPPQGQPEESRRL